VRAWWSYWLTFGLAAVLWIGVAIAVPAGGMRAIRHGACPRFPYAIDRVRTDDTRQSRA
jgi:hypothetical protein